MGGTSGHIVILLFKMVLRVCIFVIVAILLSSGGANNFESDPPKTLNGNSSGESIQITARHDECPRIIPRKKWKARNNMEELPLNTPTPYAVIFHTVGGYCDTEDDCMESMRSFQDLHVKDFGWADIAYNFVIGGDGNVYEGRGWDVKGSHSRYYNRYAQGIALTGFYGDDVPSELMLTTLRALLSCLKQRGKLHPCYTLYGHCQTRDTSSPGEAFYDLLQTWPEWRYRDDSVDNPDPYVQCQKNPDNLED